MSIVVPLQKKSTMMNKKHQTNTNQHGLDDQTEKKGKKIKWVYRQNLQKKIMGCVACRGRTEGSRQAKN